MNQDHDIPIAAPAVNETPLPPSWLLEAPRVPAKRHTWLIVSLLVTAGLVAILWWKPWATARDHSAHAVLPGTAITDSAASHKEMIHLDDHDLIAANVKTVPVEYRSVRQDLNVSAGVDYNEATHTVVTSRFAGRIERLFINRTGEYVRKGAPLLEIYSPELINAQRDYLIARESPVADIVTLSGGDTLLRSKRKERDNRLIVSARKRLQLLGMSSAQISALEQKGDIAYTTIVFSPASGVVIKRAVTNGAYVAEGTLLIDLVDLSTVWVMANVYETDVYKVKPGMQMKITGETLGGETLIGRVEFIDPSVDQQSRTVKVRGVFANPGVLLKPGMYVDASINVPIVDALAVPIDAVVRTGKRDLVYVQVKPNQFEARTVELGVTDGEYQQIVLGDLNSGDLVVADGGFLIDSEMRLNSGASDPHAGMKGMGGGK